ncbi:glycoside hydrolase family 172 protein [Acidobacteriota bacterium]
MLKKIGIGGFILLCGTLILTSADQNFLERLGQHQDYVSRRISSFDRSGGNNDRVSIDPGETAVLAEITGPAAVHHIWVTIAAEAFYGRKITLKLYWDGEDFPSVEAPIGDFFGVGHGLDRNLRSLPIVCSSEGRARNCYWYMPFQKSALITVTNEGSEPVGAFYYYIDYRILPSLPPDTPYFHAQYRQETPCIPGRNYKILEAIGRGHYVGCNLSILQRAMGWWGEGDDMIYVDGEEFPSLYGTGSEDYFSDAWGMREENTLFYGCPLQEPDFKTGSKATVYRFHVPDPIPFKESIDVTIEHGHDNNRSDYFSSVAYWYQDEPHKEFSLLPETKLRIPFAHAAVEGFRIPNWEKLEEGMKSNYMDRESGTIVSSSRLVHSLSSFYDQAGKRYPVLETEEGRVGSTATVSLDVQIGEFYDVDLVFLKGPSHGKLRVKEMLAEFGPRSVVEQEFDGYSEEKALSKLSLKNLRLFEGTNDIVLEIIGKGEKSKGFDIAFVGLTITPTRERFVREWSLIGPFDAPDMSFLQSIYPPERETELDKEYSGKDDIVVGWKIFETPEGGFARLENVIEPSERGIIYGLAYVYSPVENSRTMMIGSDDGVKIWVNEKLVHTNPAYRGAYPDQDRVNVDLREGWNKILIKVLQGGGGWGFYVRFVDPDGELVYSREPKKRP